MDRSCVRQGGDGHSKTRLCHRSVEREPNLQSEVVGLIPLADTVDRPTGMRRDGWHCCEGRRGRCHKFGRSGAPKRSGGPRNDPERFRGSQCDPPETIGLGFAGRALIPLVDPAAVAVAFTTELSRPSCPTGGASASWIPARVSIQMSRHEFRSLNSYSHVHLPHFKHILGSLAIIMTVTSLPDWGVLPHSPRIWLGADKPDTTADVVPAPLQDGVHASPPTGTPTQRLHDNRSPGLPRHHRRPHWPASQRCAEGSIGGQSDPVRTPVTADLPGHSLGSHCPWQSPARNRRLPRRRSGVGHLLLPLASLHRTTGSV